MFLATELANGLRRRGGRKAWRFAKGIRLLRGGAVGLSLVDGTERVVGFKCELGFPHIILLVLSADSIIN